MEENLQETPQNEFSCRERLCLEKSWQSFPVTGQSSGTTTLNQRGRGAGCSLCNSPEFQPFSRNVLHSLGAGARLGGLTWKRLFPMWDLKPPSRGISLDVETPSLHSRFPSLPGWRRSEPLKVRLENPLALDLSPGWSHSSLNPLWSSAGALPLLSCLSTLDICVSLYFHNLPVFHHLKCCLLCEGFTISCEI